MRMDVLTSETCWALNKEIIKQVTSSWSLFTQIYIYIYIYIYWVFSRLVWCGEANCWPKNLPMFCSLCMAASRWRRFSSSWVANRAPIPMSMSWTFQTTSHWYVPACSMLWLDKHLFTLRIKVKMCKSQLTIITSQWSWMLILQGFQQGTWTVTVCYRIGDCSVICVFYRHLCTGAAKMSQCTLQMRVEWLAWTSISLKKFL